MTDRCHAKTQVPDEHAKSAEYIDVGARIALGQAVYDRLTTLGISQAELARRADNLDRHFPPAGRRGHADPSPAAATRRPARRRTRT
jgi:hypothetical protein